MSPLFIFLHQNEIAVIVWACISAFLLIALIIEILVLFIRTR